MVQINVTVEEMLDIYRKRDTEENPLMEALDAFSKEELIEHIVKEESDINDDADESYEDLDDLNEDKEELSDIDL